MKVSSNYPNYAAEDHAFLFGALAKATYDVLGDQAEPIVKDAVVRYGHQRGRRMRKRAERDGLPICMATYLLYREYQLRPGQFCSTTAWNDQGDMQDCATKCPWAETWKRYNLSMYAAVYCRNIDAALAKGFDESAIIESKANLTDGAPCCDLWFRGAAYQRQENLEHLELDRRARLPWVYHLAHIYRVFSDTLTEEISAQQAESILECARKSYQQFCRHDDALAFLKLLSLDFDSIGDY